MLEAGDATPHYKYAVGVCSDPTRVAIGSNCLMLPLPLQITRPK
jgi:hypothetical protein